MTLLQSMPYGATVSVPSGAEPLKNSTFVTEPSTSLAVAVTVIVAGSVNVAPLAGEVMLTDGSWLLGVPPPI